MKGKRELEKTDVGWCEKDVALAGNTS